jgi:hypothetical protein
MLQPHLLKATAAASAAAVAASIATATATIASATATATANATVAAAAAAGNQGNAGQQWYYYHLLHGGLSQNPNHTSPQYTSKMEGHQE